MADRAQDSEPVYAPTTGRLIYRDDFDEYASARAMWASRSSATRFLQPTFGSGLDDSLVLLSPGRGGSGHALRLIYSGAAQDAHDWDLVNMPKLPDTTTHNFQYWARVTLGYPLGDSLVIAVKWFEAFHTDFDRVQWNTHDHLPCPLQRPSEGTYWEVYDQSRGTVCQGNQPVGPYPPEVFDGAWHRFTYQYRPNTVARSRDGFARMWVDGIKVIDISAATVGLMPPGGYKPWAGEDDLDTLASGPGAGINLLRWGGASTRSGPPFTIDIDDFVWWIPRSVHGASPPLH